MKLRKIFVMCMISLTVFLCGCTDGKTKEIVLDTYEAYWQMCKDVTGNVQMGNWWEYPEVGKSGYYPINDERYQSLDDVWQAIESVCTQNGFEAELAPDYFQRDNPLFIEENDTIYMYDIQGYIYSRYTDREDVKVQILEQKEDYIHATLEFESEWDNGTLVAIVEMKLVLEDGVWKVDDITRTDK